MRPAYLVRVLKFNEGFRILAQLKAGHPWKKELVEDVKRFFLDESTDEISAFEADTPDRFDIGHAMGVVALMLGSKDYDAGNRAAYVQKLEKVGDDQKKRRDVNDDFAKTRFITFVVPMRAWTRCTERFAPETNMCFTPADDRHYDVRVGDRDACARQLLDALAAGSVTATKIEKADLRSQAAVALAECVRRFGALMSGQTPTGWASTESLSAVEQLTRLRFLAGDQGFSIRF